MGRLSLTNPELFNIKSKFIKPQVHLITFTETNHLYTFQYPDLWIMESTQGNQKFPQINFKIKDKTVLMVGINQADFSTIQSKYPGSKTITIGGRSGIQEGLIIFVPMGFSDNFVLSLNFSEKAKPYMDGVINSFKFTGQDKIESHEEWKEYKDETSGYSFKYPSLLELIPYQEGSSKGIRLKLPSIYNNSQVFDGDIIKALVIENGNKLDYSVVGEFLKLHKKQLNLPDSKSVSIIQNNSYGRTIYSYYIALKTSAGESIEVADLAVRFIPLKSSILRIEGYYQNAAGLIYNPAKQESFFFEHGQFSNLMTQVFERFRITE